MLMLNRTTTSLTIVMRMATTAATATTMKRTRPKTRGGGARPRGCLRRRRRLLLGGGRRKGRGIRGSATKKGRGMGGLLSESRINLSGGLVSPVWFTALALKPALLTLVGLNYSPSARVDYEKTHPFRPYSPPPQKKAFKRGRGRDRKVYKKARSAQLVDSFTI